MKAAFIGFGDFGQQIFALAKQLYTLEHTIIFDDYYKSSVDLPTLQVMPFNEYSNNTYNNYHFFVCLGYKHLKLKQKIINQLLANQSILPNLIHPSSFVSNEAQLASAVYVYPMCNIDRNVVIGNGTLLNNSVTISHDTRIGECCYICPGVTTAGFITVDDRSFIGAGTVISNGVTIGHDVVVGIGTSVTNNISNEASTIGNPMRHLKNRLTLS